MLGFQKVFYRKSCVINANTKIGKGSIINTNSSIDHDCKIGNFCHIAQVVYYWEV